MASVGKVRRGPYRTTVRNKKVLLSLTEEELARVRHERDAALRALDMTRGPQGADRYPGVV